MRRRFDPTSQYGGYIVITDFSDVAYCRALRGLERQMKRVIPFCRRRAVGIIAHVVEEAERRAMWALAIKEGVIASDTPMPEGRIWTVGWKYRP